ncbi:unnamed protein product [Meganyctiphanes norvegica]|uniref:Uncharacterized protein n=1 Tax=Meganyctiphanes norvegica TaxID=48144 RepID=A0AAV2QWR1_MEGNR
MHQGLTGVILLLALLPAAPALHLPQQAQGTRLGDQLLQIIPEGGDSSKTQPVLDPSRLRDTIHQLLSLNDGELKALMAGTPPHELANSLSPATAFFLVGSRPYLQQLQTLLSSSSALDIPNAPSWDMRIAQRGKKSRGVRQSSTSTSGPKEDSDSLLGALTELSDYLEGGDIDEQIKSRSRRSHRKSSHSRNNQIGHRPNHMSWLRPDMDCGRSYNGRQKRHCPTSSSRGEWKCIDDDQLCDGNDDCPNHEDEDPTHCLFFDAMSESATDLQDMMFTILNGLRKVESDVRRIL